jgi:hypothetical protein
MKAIVGVGIFVILMWATGCLLVDMGQGQDWSPYPPGYYETGYGGLYTSGNWHGNQYNAILETRYYYDRWGMYTGRQWMDVNLANNRYGQWYWW